MKITSARFLLSASSVAECPPGSAPEIAVSGRSNVGKSSLLNSLVRQRALAKVSSTPGRTQLLNYFVVNERFHLVDLPGYGFAKAPATERNRWARMMQGYLRTRRQLTALVQLVDIRHEPSREDREMVAWLRTEAIPFCLVPTKSDKLSAAQCAKSVRAIVASLELPPEQPVIPYSSQTGAGRLDLLEWFEATIEAAERG